MSERVLVAFERLIALLSTAVAVEMLCVEGKDSSATVRLIASGGYPHSFVVKKGTSGYLFWLPDQGSNLGPAD